MYLNVQILLAIDLALDCKDTQTDLWNRICRDEYMAYAVKECYYSVEKILYSLVDNEGRLWYEFHHSLLKFRKFIYKGSVMLCTIPFGIFKAFDCWTGDLIPIKIFMLIFLKLKGTEIRVTVLCVQDWGTFFWL